MPNARKIADFPDREFALVDSESGRTLHQFSRSYTDLLIRTCASRWLAGEDVRNDDYIVKRHSVTADEWEVKRDEIGDVSRVSEGYANDARGLVNRYEISFCRTFFVLLAADRRPDHHAAVRARQGPSVR